jgi:uncharacterized protein with FMN-binding domain
MASKRRAPANQRRQLPHQQAAGAGATVHQGKRRRRLTDGLIGLSSAAVLSVYGLGYLHTRATAQHPSVSVSRTLSNSVAASPTQPSRTLGQPTPAQSSRAATPTPTGSYKDGTYIGRGTSRHGGIEATVVVKDGALVSALVSKCLTRYSCSYVDPLTQEVVRTQKVPVSHISGATDSSNAYKQAVHNALAQAS